MSKTRTFIDYAQMTAEPVASFKEGENFFVLVPNASDEMWSYHSVSTTAVDNIIVRATSDAGRFHRVDFGSSAGSSGQPAQVGPIHSNVAVAGSIPAGTVEWSIANRSATVTGTVLGQNLGPGEVVSQRRANGTFGLIAYNPGAGGDFKILYAS